MCIKAKDRAGLMVAALCVCKVAVLHIEFDKVYFWKLLFSVFSFSHRQWQVCFYEAAGKQQTNSPRLIFMIT